MLRNKPVKNKVRKFELKTVVQIAMQLTDLLKDFHSCGYIYNDLKPENICVGDHVRNYRDFHDLNLHELKLIDFGLSSSYLEKNAKGEKIHIKKGYKQFQGNIAFSSYNSFLRKQVSRRDDFISMVYFLYYLVTGDVLFADRTKSNKEQIMLMKEMKIKSRPKDFLNTEELQCFIGVSEYIFSIKFSEEPNYNKIKWMYAQILLDRDIVPSREFDWNQKFLNKERKRKEE